MTPASLIIVIAARHGCVNAGMDEGGILTVHGTAGARILARSAARHFCLTCPRLPKVPARLRGIGPEQAAEDDKIRVAERNRFNARAYK